VFKRSLTLVVVGMLALAFVQAALAVSVHVRVEGKTQTIFGAIEPKLSVQATALDALQAASSAGEFYYHLTQYASGPFVDQIGLYGTTSTDGWFFKVNGVLSQVGAGDARLKDGDTVLWYWGVYGPTFAGPPTLLLKHVRKPGCYRAFTQDASGKLAPAAGAVLHVDGRTAGTKSGGACLRGRHGLVRATMTGAVRSNALR
jgi:hypothetical protein